MAYDVSEPETTVSPPAPGEPALGEPAVGEAGVGGLTEAETLPWGTPPPPPPPTPKKAKKAARPKALPRRRDRHATRRPAVGLAALIATALVATFFGWVSAEPFWLAMGRGTEGTVTVTSCRDSGLETRCVGRFDGDAFAVDATRLAAVPESARERGATFDARMLDADSGWAYAGPVSGLHLRWWLGAAAVVLCGLLVGLVTGVRRLRSAGAGKRFLLWALGFAGPLAIFGGMLATAAF